jgi:hypothetical protein
MPFAGSTSSTPDDSPEARRYNRIHRWLGIADFVIGAAFLVVLLSTGWTGWLRDLAYRCGFQNYTLAVFIYLLFLLLISKALGLGLDYYGFRLERRFQLSTQKFRSWIWDEAKGFLVGLVLAGIVVELLYFMIRQFAAALVAHYVGAIHGVVHIVGAARPRGAVPHLLQIRTAGERRSCAGGWFN